MGTTAAATASRAPTTQPTPDVSALRQPREPQQPSRRPHISAACVPPEVAGHADPPPQALGLTSCIVVGGHSSAMVRNIPSGPPWGQELAPQELCWGTT